MKDGSFITMIDYASAGKTWNRDSVMTAWMATKNYWNVDFSKPVYLNCMTHCNPDYCTVDEENALHGEQSNEKRDIFTLEETGDGYYYIRSADGRYLTLKGENAEDTAYFTEKLDCDCQKWDIRPFVQNRYEILHKRPAVTCGAFSVRLSTVCMRSTRVRIRNLKYTFRRSTFRSTPCS